MAIQHQFPKSPSDIIYTAVSFMQKWSILLKEADRWSHQASEGQHLALDWKLQAHGVQLY